MPKTKILPLFKKPLGPSAIRDWNIDSCVTTRGALCEMCGTSHPAQLEDGEGYTLATVLGGQMVEECCGIFLDQLYVDVGENFALAFLEEFCENPLDPRFMVFRATLIEKMRQARERGQELVEEARDVLDAIPAK